MQTSRKDVFAAGDFYVVKYNPADDTTNSVRMGTLIAYNIFEPKLKYMGTQGTSGIKIYGKCIASTELTEDVAKNTTSFNVDSVLVSDNYRPEFMPTYEEALLKLIYDKDSRRVLGGQIISNLDLAHL